MRRTADGGQGVARVTTSYERPIPFAAALAPTDCGIRPEGPLELPQVLRGNVRHRRKPEAAITPFRNLKSVLGRGPLARGFCRPDEQVHRVKPPMIDDRRDRLPVDRIEPTAGQRETLIGELRNRRRKVDLAV